MTMGTVSLKIDGRDVVAEEGTTVLDAARRAGIDIPTLCHHEKLEPLGGCRLCMVEVESRGKSRLVVSCVYAVEKGLNVRTRSEKVDRVRKGVLELLLAHAPDSPQLDTLAREYGAKRGRFDPEPAFCILCGLCVRYCAEVVGKNAVGFIDRGTRREISFIPEIASKECDACKACFPLCPTSYAQAAYVLTKSLVFPEAAGTSHAGPCSS